MASTQDEKLLGQGAEAKVWKSSFFDRPCVVKERVVKRYRHPALEASLSKKRLNMEARCILRARKNGVAAPCIYHIDYEAARIYMSFVVGQTLKDWLMALPSNDEIDSKLTTVGQSIASLHDADVVHGDLTSSNIMVVSDDNGSCCLIDFGLSYVSGMPEDKAVDLYVLERALESTHTQTHLMDKVLVGYKASKRAGASLAKLADVRLRGRKRVMVG